MSNDIGRVLMNRYRLEEKVGEGGMALVYRAVDVNTMRNVAVKVLKPQYNSNADYVSRFQREAEAASKMTHHNIVNLLDVGRDGDTRFLVMEYVRGQTLKKIIQERGRLSPNIVADVTLRILSALQHAHENGIIHRDIKPQNILMDERGMVKVADFGIARMANTATLSRGDDVVGTVQYFSPEQAKAQGADARSDLYSVGIVMYEMLTGRLPFDGQNEVAIMMQHIHTMPDPIEKYAPEVPAALAHVCMMALEKDPMYRYQSAWEMATELRMAMDGRVDMMQPRVDPESGYGLNLIQNTPQHTDPGKATKEKHTQRTKPRRRINFWWWAVTMLAALIVCAGIYFGSVAIYEQVVNSVTVPYFVTMDTASAEKTATRAGLTVRKVEINHPTIAEGTVIMQAPEDGSTLRKGDTVVLTISKGPASLTVPMLTGYTSADATAIAQSYGLIPAIEYIVSTDVQVGFVSSQYPEVGTQCESGDVVTLTVSGGSVVVPDLKNYSLESAQQLLTDAGLKMSTNVTFVPSEDEKQHGKVMSQSPEANTQVLQNASVALRVYQVQSMTHHIVWPLKLNANASAETVRITLKNDTTMEYTAYQGEFPAGDLVRTEEVVLTAQEAGTYIVSVFINGVFDHADPNPVTIE